MELRNLNRSEDLEESSSLETFVDTEDTTEDQDLFSPLPCEEPSVSSSGVAVFGRRSESEDRIRTQSISVNRVNFPHAHLTCRPELLNLELPVVQIKMDEASYKGFKLNCFKRKRKVENMIELYDKECVNSLQDKDIYQKKLDEISAAALDALEYISDLIAQLEVNNEVDRVNELTAIKNSVRESVRKNEKEVKSEMQRIVDEAEAKLTPHDPTHAVEGAGFVIPHSSTPYSFPVNPTAEPKLQLRLNYIQEDAQEINTAILPVKEAKDLTDSEIIYYMREGKNWSKRVDDLVSENRKFQLESFGLESLTLSAASLDETVKNVKRVKDEKLATIAKEDECRGLSSLCENKNKSLDARLST